MSKILFILIGLAFSQLNAQTETPKDSVDIDSLSTKNNVFLSVLPEGKLVEYVDSFYYATEALQKKINLSKCPDLVNGYRVQIFSCSGSGCQEKATKYYNQFLIAYPNVPVYKLWQPPTLKVRAGDCRTRFEAEKIKSEIKQDFPFVFIVPDHIESPYKIDCEEMEISESDSLLILPLRNQK